MTTDAQILVVDDEQGIRDLLGSELGRLGHEVTAARDGAEAIEHLERDDFDLVITDVRMPGRDGIAVLKAARAAAPTTEVMVLTAFAELGAAVECLRHGAFDLIHKPFDLTELLSAVERAIDHRRLRTNARLYEAGQALLLAGGEQPVCERIAAMASEVLGADDVSVMLMDGGGRLRIAYSTGLPDAVQKATRLDLGERVAGRVAIDRTPALLPQSLADDPRFDGLRSFGRVSSSIIHPLVHQGRVVGVLNVNRLGSSRPYRRTDLETCGIVAAQAALAVANEGLTEQVVASERLAGIGLLASGIVHEIKNPLAYVDASASFVISALDGLRRGEDGSLTLSGDEADEVLAALADVRAGTERLAEIVSDVRGFTRGADDVSEVVDLNEAVRFASRLAAPALRRAGHLDLELCDRACVTGSLGLLGQVFLNLLVNAAQALEGTAGRPGRIRVCSRRVGDEVVVEVADDGPGIAPENLGRVLEAFYTTKPRNQGSGLGLSICREIVEAHGGRIEVASTPGQGATFSVRLPASVDAAAGEG